MKTYFIIILFFSTINSYSQRENLNLNEYNTWQKENTYDEFNDINGIVDVIGVICSNSKDIAYIYDFDGGVSIEFYATENTIYKNNPSGTKNLYVKGLNAYKLKIKFSNNRIETFDINASEDGGFEFQDNSKIAKLILENKQKNLKFNLYFENKIIQSFSIN